MLVNRGNLEYQCPIDLNSMPKLNGKFYCGSCEKSVSDLTKKTDFEVLQQVSRYKGLTCLKIEKSRLGLITGKIPKWKLLIVLVLNIKSFFIQKISAQNLNFSSSSSPKHSLRTYIVNGRVRDNETGKPVKYPTIEIYKDSVLIKTIKGDRKGNFELVLPLEAFNVVSLKIYSDIYVGSLIAKLPMIKENSTLEVRIKKVGQPNELKKISEPEQFYYGNVRFLD